MAESGFKLTTPGLTALVATASSVNWVLDLLTPEYFLPYMAVPQDWPLTENGKHKLIIYGSC